MLRPGLEVDTVTPRNLDQILDSRLVLGINPWIKPIKFALSITIYVWTVAWLVESLRISSYIKRIITWGISISMLTEIACITAQAARGTTSHYNVHTSFDAAIFATMGVMIALKPTWRLCASRRPSRWSCASWTQAASRSPGPGSNRPAPPSSWTAAP